MQKAIITRNGIKAEYIASEFFGKVENGITFLGFYPEGKKRRTWIPVGGNIDDNNDYTGTKVAFIEWR